MNDLQNIVNHQGRASRKWKKDLSTLSNFINMRFPHIPLFIEDISTYIRLKDYENNRIKTIQTIGRIIRKDDVFLIIDLKKKVLFPICLNSLSISEVFVKTPHYKYAIWVINEKYLQLVHMISTRSFHAE